MNFAIRISPVSIGSVSYSSVIFGDERSLVPVSKWPDFAIPKALITDDGVLFRGSPWQIVSAITAGKDFVPRDYGVETDHNSYLITWQSNEKDE